MDSSHACKYSGRVRAGAQPDGCVKDAVADDAFGGDLINSPMTHSNP